MNLLAANAVCIFFEAKNCRKAIREKDLSTVELTWTREKSDQMDLIFLRLKTILGLTHSLRLSAYKPMRIMGEYVFRQGVLV